MDFARDVLKIEPLPWQRWLLIHALEVKPSGLFRFRTIVILVARQNGKTSLVEIKNLWKLFVLGVPLVIGTAQNLDISEESWDKAVEIAESVPELQCEIEHVDRTNGKKALRLISGARWKIAAASRKGGRGLSGDDVNLDELREHQTWDAWGAVTKTTMARPNAQIWCFSNAGDDKSVVLNELQAKARATVDNPNADKTLGLFEWSAADDVKCTCGMPAEHATDCRLRDLAGRAQANPALGYTITNDALESALSTDPETVYRTECLCQRVPDMQPDWSVIPRPAWEALAVEAPKQTAIFPIVFAIDTNPERSHSSIAVVGRLGDRLYVEIAEHHPGTGWVVPWIVDKVDRWEPEAVVVDPASPAGSLIAELEAQLVTVTKPTSRQVAQGCGVFFDAIIPSEDGDEPLLRHSDQPELTAAVAAAITRDLGDAWAWARKSTAVDISPLVAATLGVWAHGKFCPPDYDVSASVY